MNDHLQSCTNVYVYIHEVDKKYDIVVDDVRIDLFSANDPTYSPSFAATEEVMSDDTAPPSSSPTSRPTVSSVTSCPAEENSPTELSAGPLMLERSGTLCLLTKTVASNKLDRSCSCCSLV